MKTLKKSLLLILAAGCSIFCTPQENPESTKTDMQLEIPSKIVLEEDAATIEFNVIDGKAPIQTDLVILDGPAGQKFCKILSVSQDKITVELYSGLRKGQHKISIQRGLDTFFLGTTIFDFKQLTDDDAVTPAEGSTIYGKVSCKGTGIAGVVVSDGVNATTTDRNGVYQLASEKKLGYVFISVPSGYNVPVDTVFPQFYRNLEKSESVAERADFELIQSRDQTKYNLLVFGDMHMSKRHEAPLQFPRMASDVKAFIDEHPNELFYGVTLGDMVEDQNWKTNNYSYGFKEYKADIKSLTGLTIYQTIGNHDHSLNYNGDFDTVLEYREYLGPNYYSYNIGKIHMVALDDITCTNLDGKHHYEVTIAPEQMEWLRQDLSYVSKDMPIFVFLHSPMHHNPGSSNALKSFNMDNGAELTAFLSGFPEVHVFSGHTHIMYNGEKGNLFEHNAGAFCAAWWVSGYLSPGIHIAKDGAPGGYTVVNVNGKDVKWQYKGMTYPLETQFRTYDRNMIDLSADKNVPNADAQHRAEYEASAAYWLTEGEKNEVYINVWNVDPEWSVKVKENGFELPVTRVKCPDPLYLHTALAKRQNSNTSSDGYSNYHMFKVVASSPNSTLYITVTDRFGNVYTETMNRPRPFSIEEYRMYY